MKDTVAPPKMPKVINPRGPMTRSEVAIYLGVGRAYLCNLAKRGLFEGNVSTFYGADRLYTKGHVDRWRKRVRHYSRTELEEKKTVTKKGTRK